VTPSSFFTKYIFSILVQPAQNRWRSSGDISHIYDSATPNPTGSLSGPWFDPSGSRNVTGVVGKPAHLACRVKNLGKQTVRNFKNIFNKVCNRKMGFVNALISLFYVYFLGFLDSSQGRPLVDRRLVHVHAGEAHHGHPQG
jgi:hypothetical protein